jgi:hypothetical protein
MPNASECLGAAAIGAAGEGIIERGVGPIVRVIEETVGYPRSLERIAGVVISDDLASVVDAPSRGTLRGQRIGDGDVAVSALAIGDSEEAATAGSPNDLACVVDAECLGVAVGKRGIDERGVGAVAVEEAMITRTASVGMKVPPDDLGHIVDAGGHGLGGRQGIVDGCENAAA